MFFKVFGIPLLSLVILYSTPSAGQDPCLEGQHRHLPDLVKRSPLYKMDSSPLCDRYITEAWYRTKYHVMSTSPPGLTSCGTTYPTWLSGSTPSDGVTKNMTACEVGFFNDCTRQYTIEVKNCSAFFVYKLKPLDLCNAAYCFEHGDECVNETVSNVSVSFHNITWKSISYSPDLALHDPYLNLMCSFTPSDDDTLLYHIDWYVDNDTVIQGQTVDKESLQDAILSAEDLNKAGKKINSWIHCVVGTKAAKDKIPCFSTPSELFFAGIEVLNETVNVQRSGAAIIMLRPTIPILSPTLENNGTQMPLNVQVELSAANSNALCTIRDKECEKRIDVFTYGESQKYDDPSNWQKIYPILVNNIDDANYVLPNIHLVQRLKTSVVDGQGTKIFSQAPLHDVNINVVENNGLWKGRICSSSADPHMKTFDGYRYECQATGCLIGETYILYRNEVYRQEVQVRHAVCWGWAKTRCICAVAVRAGKDVFTIDACNGGQYINFPRCDENSLKVVKESDTIYKVTLPKGTMVKIRLFRRRNDPQSWYINTLVYPTVADITRTSGLCGPMDGNQRNDLRRRNGVEDDIDSFNRIIPPDSFSLSWRADSTEDLLTRSQTVYDQLTSLASQFHKLCLCDGDKISCSYKHFDGCTTNVRGKEYHCVLHSASKSKRDARHVPNLQTYHDTNEVLMRTKRQVHVLSEVQAFNACNTAFQQSTFYNTCLESVPNFTNSTLENCIIDLMVTGEESLTQLHLDTALGECQEYIILNYTLLNENPNITTAIINLCLNNCSNRGVCSQGTCACDHGYGGSDCSFDVRSPPTITRLLDDGICDKSNDVCNDITLYGHYFVENMGTTCYITREQINESNSAMSTESYSVRLEERTLYEGYCSLQYGPETSWVTTFRFNLSNDGTQYSETYTVYVYQSKCQTFQNDSGVITFSLQSGYCFINGSCIQSGTFQSNDSCWQCIPQSDPYDWTWDCNSTDSTNSNITTTTTTITTTIFSTIPASSSADMTSSTASESTSSSPFTLTTLTSSNGFSETTSSPMHLTTLTGSTTILESITEEDQGEQLTPNIIALIAVVTLVAALILLITIFLIRKWIQGKQTKGLSAQEEAYTHPKTKRHTVTTGHLVSNNLLHFESSSEKYSRSSTSSSIRTMSPTNDLSSIYDQKRLDKMFGVPK